ncbi:TolB family protein [Caldisericum sp.]|jgi:dipeptidyl aminopeptidase/acylaminoacyl peptidase|uniref:TolB family protein n=1 Tax=Caldisericum sp. TaxID=2499687 RepID=UPI003D0C91A8
MQRKTFLVLTTLLLLTLLTTSCSIRQTGGFHTPLRFSNVIIYSASDGIHTVNFEGKDDKLIVLKSDVLKLYDKRGEFNEVTLGNVGISSNGNKLLLSAFFRKSPQGQTPEITHSVLFSVDSDGRNLKQLTPENVDFYEKQISHDKNLLAFIGITMDKGEQKRAIYIVQMDDGKVTRVTPWYYDTTDSNGSTSAGITEFSFSKDSKKILFVGKSKNGNNYDLNMYNIEKKDLKAIVSDAMGVTIHDWSPDGKKIAFSVAVSGSHLCPEEKLCVVDSDGSGFKQISREFYYIHSLKWSSDSSKILFCHFLKPVTIIQGSKNVFLSVVDSNGTAFKEIGGYDIIQGYWAPDGRRIVAVIGQDIDFALEETTGKQAIYEINIDSMNPMRITPYYASIEKLILHPTNSNKIIFTTGIFPYLNTLWMLNLGNRSMQTIKSFDENQDITNIVFSPDYKRYFIRVLKTTFDTTHNLEQNASLYVYDANTNALIGKFEGENEYLTNIEWIDNQKVCFIKGIMQPGVAEGNFGNLCILDVDSGKTVELTQANIDFSYGWWLAINE